MLDRSETVDAVVIQSSDEAFIVSPSLYSSATRRQAGRDGRADDAELGQHERDVSAVLWRDGKFGYALARPQRHLQILARRIADRC
jgi:hypothetical protein